MTGQPEEKSHLDHDLISTVIITMVFKLFIYSLSNYNPRNKLAYGIPLQVKII